MGGMKLVVRLIEARSLPPTDPNGLRDSYAKLQLGKQKFRTKVVKKNLNPSWGEEFSFKVEDLKEELVVGVLDEDKYFNDDIVGQIKVPVSQVFDADNQSLGTVWYSLQPKNKKSRFKECGEILLSICFSQSFPDSNCNASQSKKNVDVTLSPSRSFNGTNNSSPARLEETASSKEEKFFAQKNLAGRIVQIFNKNSDVISVTTSRSTEISEQSETDGSEVFDDKAEDQSSSGNFEELMKEMESRDVGSEVPNNLPGGILVDQSYVISPPDLNSLFFSPDSNLARLLSDFVGNSEQQFGPWRFENSSESLKRVITYVKAPTKLVGALKASEEQTYLKADGKIFAILISVSTPDVMYGSTFKVELLYCITPGPELPSGEKTSHLVISWRMNFLQSSMFKVFMTLYVFVHVWLAAPSAIQGLEFVGLDLPDSIGEVIVCGVLALQCERVLGLLSRFMQARAQKGTDHGVKAQGDGWVLTVALIEGSHLPAVDSSGFCDPYVVFTCNGKTRTSSIKFQKSDPLWNEIFEFDAMDDPPSVLDVEVYDFDGPFNEAMSLGHTEINFVKSNLSDLADVWVPLQGKLAQACQSKLHLRIFLNNTRGSNVVKEYLSKMEKEVGKKINLRSPQTNSAFQKVFGLPPEEFLINDFTCHLKRRMPLQGRLFLSARIIGFYANLFRQKTKFFFLWEDIVDIQVDTPTLSSMGSPIIVITLRQGRGMDARHGAKTTDDEGRLKFHFQSFVSFNVANRTIMALWKARSLSPEQKVQIVEEESETKFLQTEESGSFLGLEDVSMSEIYSYSLSVPINFLSELFGGGELDRKVMEKAGCLTYSSTPWESVKTDVYERQLYYRFDKHVSRFGGEVTSTQQKYPLSDRKGWIVEDVMTLHGVPLGDFFNLHLRYQIEDFPSRLKGCHVRVSTGIAWLKSTRHQKRISKNIISSLKDRLKLIFNAVEKEFENR
ncbi:hypothetical protein NC653_015250 [Populus alba x Populus x berolinensis]|uniref:C2 and GRAM domain-containing protein n=1 Tax=Populus alba x Populus x berolinensis TaxID=444605 RepID=A0AAD6QK25_9ROSI|nr:hypothetical protein NC653_015250 [Populus alba x Populus x berolinensis]